MGQTAWHTRHNIKPLSFLLLNVFVNIIVNIKPLSCLLLNVFVNIIVK